MATNTNDDVTVWTSREQVPEQLRPALDRLVEQAAEDVEAQAAARHRLSA